MLKKISLILLFCVGAFAANINWVPSYKVAVEKAKKENKPIMLMLSQPGCPACIQMKEVVFKNDELESAEWCGSFKKGHIYWSSAYQYLGFCYFISLLHLCWR